MLVTRTCGICGVEFTTKDRGEGRGLYCSRRCQATAGGRARAARGMLGEDNPAAKLTASKVRWILVAESRGWTQRAMARRLGVCQRTICAALMGTNWAHVTTR